MVFEDYKLQLVAMQNKYNRINELLSYEEVVLDNKLCVKLEKEKRELQPIVEKYEQYLYLLENLKEYYVLTGMSPEEKDVILKEINNLNTSLNAIKKEIITLIVNNDAKWESIVVEIVFKNDIRLGKDIVNSFIKFATTNNFDCNNISIKDGVRLEIDGLNVKGIYSSNIGVHVDNNGESVQVFVYDNIAMPNISFDDKYISITTCRSSGAGGQHINTTDSAIRAVHLPTGLVATCQSERSQSQNKKIALLNLKNRVNEYYQNKRTQMFENFKKEQVKLMKSKFIVKTYNYELGIIITKEKKEISLKDFLMGKQI